jgi:hypothetical protein
MNPIKEKSPTTLVTKIACTLTKGDDDGKLIKNAEETVLITPSTVKIAPIPPIILFD